MKKFDLVHTTILIVAILSGYASLQYLVSILSTIAYSINPVNPLYSQINYFSIISNNFLMGALDAIIAIILIRNSRKYAGLILKDEAGEETHQLGLDRQNIILALFIGMGLYMLIQAIPQVLSDAYRLFSRKIDPTSIPEQTPPGTIAVLLLKVVIGAFLIYAAPSFARSIEKNIAPRPGAQKTIGQPEEPTIQQPEEPIIQQPEPSSHPQTQPSNPQDV